MTGETLFFLSGNNQEFLDKEDKYFSFTQLLFHNVPEFPWINWQIVWLYL